VLAQTLGPSALSGHRGVTGSTWRGIRGHPWNLVFTPEERAAVIAFLRTL
jgi:hypothetical protein